MSAALWPVDHMGARVRWRLNPYRQIAFLGAGEWTVEMLTDGPWELRLSPVLGPTGGGARGF